MQLCYFAGGFGAVWWTPHEYLKKKKKRKRKGKLLARVLTSYDCTKKKNRVAGGISSYQKKKGQHERCDERNNDEERTKYL